MVSDTAKLRMHDKVWVRKGPYLTPGKVIYASETGTTIKVQQYKMKPGTKIVLWLSLIHI